MSANAEPLQAVYNYQQTVLNASTEVVNYMSKVEKYAQSIEIKKQQLEASVDSATKFFQNARAEYVEVLSAQRDLQDAKMGIIETKKQRLAAIVRAYQAYGGGMARSYQMTNYVVTDLPASYPSETSMPGDAPPANAPTDPIDATKDLSDEVPIGPVLPIPERSL